MNNVFRFLVCVWLVSGVSNVLQAQWSQTSGPSGVVVNELLLSGPNLFAGTDRGVFRSTDNGVSWLQVNTGLTDTMIVALAVSGTTLFAGDWVNGVFRSTDNGEQWTGVNNGITDTFISDLLVSGTILFAGTADGGQLYRSTNNGDTWTQPTNGLEFYDGIVLALSGTDVLLGDDESVIFRTTNNGVIWTQTGTGLPGAHISALVVSGSILFAGTARGVLLSTDNGANWTQVNNGLTDTSVNALALSGTDIFAGTQSGIFRSDDNGANWIQLNGGLTDTAITALTSSGTHLLAGTETSGVYQALLSHLPVELTSFIAEVNTHGVEFVWKTATETNNYGFEIERCASENRSTQPNGSLEWRKISFVEGHGTTNSPKEYSYSDRYLSSGTYLYRLKQIDRDGKFEYSQVVEVTIASTLKEFALAQNYPNPFNPSTVISYQLPVKSSVTVKVYDALGREAATLVNEEKEAGNHTVKFDASRLSGGIYFYTLKAGRGTATRKMLLIK